VLVGYAVEIVFVGVDISRCSGGCWFHWSWAAVSEIDPSPLEATCYADYLLNEARMRTVDENEALDTAKATGRGLVVDTSCAQNQPARSVQFLETVEENPDRGSTAPQANVAADHPSPRDDAASRLANEGKSEVFSSREHQQQHRQCRLDLQTGRHILRCQSVQRLSCQSQAGERRWRRWVKKTQRLWRTKEDEVAPEEGWEAQGLCGGDDEEGRAKRVYRIRSLYQPEHSKKNELVDDTKVSLLSEYIRWTFHASFLQVTFASYVEFLALIILFALFIWAVGIYQPECIFGGEFSTNLGPAFVDAWVF
jgi:hypothetical protein